MEIPESGTVSCGCANHHHVDLPDHVLLLFGSNRAQSWPYHTYGFSAARNTIVSLWHYSILSRRFLWRRCLYPGLSELAVCVCHIWRIHQRDKFWIANLCPYRVFILIRGINPSQSEGSGIVHLEMYCGRKPLTGGSSKREKAYVAAGGIVVIIYLIATTEEIINRNNLRGTVDQWTFGQTLSMLMLLDQILKAASRIRGRHLEDVLVRQAEERRRL